MSGGQEATIAVLSSGAASGEGGPLKRIDTHMSHVFLGRERVYKLKRAVRHPFSDMRTLAAREQACRAELAVNAALAPDLYEGVWPVTAGADGKPVLRGDGEPVDWIVVMRRFEDGNLLSEMAEEGRLTAAQIDEAIDAIAAFHAKQPARRETGHAVDYRRIVEGLRRTEGEAAHAQGLEPASDVLFGALEAAIGTDSHAIEARRRDGWVRRGHGDLHLGNICVFRGRVVPFDALEFDPALATADVLYDVAFLLMDLRARGLDDLANRAMNRYWDVCHQPEDALALMPLFMALRAAVRVAVLVEAGDLTAADRYRRIGLDLLTPSSPRLVAIGGLSGTGKSTLARALAPRLGGCCGARILRSDVIRKAEAGAEATARLADGAYTAEARRRVYEVLSERARAALEARTPVIADATFMDGATRSGIAGRAGKGNFQGLWLRATAPARMRRIAQRQGDASDITPEAALTQREPSDPGPGWHVLAAGGSPSILAGRAERLLRGEPMRSAPRG
jgi:aminoglycoside phosphotransferase family enzyme/predicted kinase